MRAGYIALAFSGAAGLFFELGWLRRLFAALGASDLAYAVAIISFFVGTAAGAVLAYHFKRRLNALAGLRGFALLEIGAFTSAALLIALWPLFDTWLIRLTLFDGRVANLLGRAAIATALVSLPTLMLGASLPVAIAKLKNASLAYAWYTLGGAAALALGGYVLMPALGVGAVLNAGVLCSSLAALVGWVAAARPPSGQPDRAVADSNGYKIWYALAFGAGFSTLVCEIRLYRLSRLIAEGTHYLQVAVLFVFVVCGGIGALFSARLMRRRRHVAYGQWATAAALAFCACMLRWAPLLISWFSGGSRAALTDQFGTFFTILIVFSPLCLMLGVAGTAASLTFVNASDAHARTARRMRVIMMSTLGALSGATVAILAPSLRIAGYLLPTICLMHLVFAAALWRGKLSMWVFSVRGIRLRQAMIGAVSICLLLPTMYWPLAYLSFSWRAPRLALSAPKVFDDATLFVEEGFFHVVSLVDTSVVKAAAAKKRTTTLDTTTLDTTTLDTTTLDTTTLDTTTLDTTTLDTTTLDTTTLDTTTLDTTTLDTTTLDTTTLDTAALDTAERSFRLLSDGVPESGAGGTPPHMGIEMIALGGLPAYFSRRRERAFVLGWGAGHCARVLRAAGYAAVDVAEIEPAVVAASDTLYAQLPARNPRHDPQVKIKFEGGREWLARTETHYDAIVSQPSHPWLAGGSMLYAHGYFELVRSKLTKGGVFVLWINLFRNSVEAITKIVATLARTLPYQIGVAADDDSLVVLSSLTPLEPRRRIGAASWRVLSTPFALTTYHDMAQHQLFARSPEHSNEADDPPFPLDYDSLWLETHQTRLGDAASVSRRSLRRAFSTDSDPMPINLGTGDNGKK